MEKRKEGLFVARFTGHDGGICGSTFFFHGSQDECEHVETLKLTLKCPSSPRLMGRSEDERGRARTRGSGTRCGLLSRDFNGSRTDPSTPVALLHVQLEDSQLWSEDISGFP